MRSLSSRMQAEAEAAARIAEFKGFYRIALAVEALGGVCLLAAPGLMTGLFALPADLGWTLVGAFLLWSVIFQAQGLMDPENARLPVVIGVIGRYLMALAFVAVGVWAFAALMALFALTLNILYHRMVTTVLMSRP